MAIAIVIARKISEPMFLQFCHPFSCGCKMAAKALGTSLHPRQEEGSGRRGGASDICPL